MRCAPGGKEVRTFSFFSIQGQSIMKTITKTLAALGLASIGLAGCADSNEKINTTDASGKPTVGVNPPGTPTTSDSFRNQNKGLMGNEKKAEAYKAETNQGSK